MKPMEAPPAPGSAGDRLAAAAAALKGVLAGLRPSGLARLRRNTALHAASVPPGGFCAASAAALKAVQRGPRLGEVSAAEADAAAGSTGSPPRHTVFYAMDPDEEIEQANFCPCISASIQVEGCEDGLSDICSFVSCDGGEDSFLFDVDARRDDGSDSISDADVSYEVVEDARMEVTFERVEDEEEAPVVDVLTQVSGATGGCQFDGLIALLRVPSIGRARDMVRIFPLEIVAYAEDLAGLERPIRKPSRRRRRLAWVLARGAQDRLR